MELQKITTLFQTTGQLLIDDWGRLTGIVSEKEILEGSSSVLHADWIAEKAYVPLATKLWPNVPVLCEEAGTSGVADLISGVSLLPHEDNVIDLPSDFISADGVDGSALYANGMFTLVSMMAGLIKDGKPHAGVLMVLGEKKLYHTGIDGKPGVFYGDLSYNEWRLPARPLKQSLIGTDDNKSVDANFRNLVINKLMGSSGFRYPLNMPSGAGALAVLKGNLAVYVTSNARNWDLATTSALCMAAGQVVRCLDGSEVPWNVVRMPPVVFARDEETFLYVHTLAKNWLNTV
ncbi:MAG TPA: inositol monophosphatase family protein [Candidatus Andersenbacteria bacterium]|nr:inositol monophosphatase family protein [Candidatus Andersenbacteria bacterium]